ncbi:hypothetical protein KCP71_09175 [Salmonella enterica subsp. enterica]|nr:hypothetical protein KCP71_09175 [Salmonella enterica subsp. enterica]
MSRPVKATLPPAPAAGAPRLRKSWNFRATVRRQYSSTGAHARSVEPLMDQVWHPSQIRPTFTRCGGARISTVKMGKTRLAEKTMMSSGGHDLQQQQ